MGRSCHVHRRSALPDNAGVNVSVRDTSSSCLHPVSSERTPEEREWLAGLEDATFGVWDLDPRLELVHYSPQWKARLGFPQLHAPDSTSFWRSRVHPDDFEAMLRALRGHLDGFAPSYEMQFRLRCNGSGYRTVLSRGRVVARDHRGDATRMVGTMIDLTGRPLAPRSHGLPADDPAQVVAVPRMPLHAVLGAASHDTLMCAAPEQAAATITTAAADAPQLVDSIADLLDMALREGRRTVR